MYFEHYANMFQDNLNHNKTFGSTAKVWDQDGRQRNSYQPQRYIHRSSSIVISVVVWGRSVTSRT